MTTLLPMPPESWPEFLEEAVAGYARENITSGRWAADEALANSRAEFDRLLPQGLATPGQHLHQIIDDGGSRVGFIWFAELGSGATRTAYVYNVHVKPEHRRRGHALAAFQVVERLAASMGLASIGLHVFAANQGAQALYRSLGYQVTGLTMRKPLTG